MASSGDFAGRDIVEEGGGTRDLKILVDAEGDSDSNNSEAEKTLEVMIASFRESETAISKG